jgi:preprotein translocase subunit SecY
MFDKFGKILKDKKVLKKIIEVLLLLVVYRILAHIPIPGVNIEALRSFFDSNELLGMVNMLSGSALKNFSIVALGVGPYITASIIIQLLTVVIPKLEALSSEGGDGVRKLEQITRYLTVPFAALQGYAMIVLLSNSNYQILGELTFASIVSMIIIFIAGTLLTMWIGEIISERKIGNGMSWIIFAGIISGFLETIKQIIVTYDPTKLFSIILYLVITVVVITGIVIVTEAQRNIPVIYARQANMRSSSKPLSYLPLRVNQAGMIPIIFASSVMTLPRILVGFLAGYDNVVAKFLSSGVSLFVNNILLYSILYFLLIIGFTYFYTSITFKPDKISENLNKQGAYVPGIKPGKQTEDYLLNVSNKLVIFGGLFLAVVAILPILTSSTPGAIASIGGAGLIIVVGVVIESIKQMEAQVVDDNYGVSKYMNVSSSNLKNKKLN